MTRFMRAGSFDREFFAGQSRPAQLEDVPFGFLQVSEHHIGPPRRLAAARSQHSQRPALERSVHQQDMERLRPRLAHEVEQVLEIGAVLAKRIGAKLASQIEARLVETVHAAWAFTPPTARPCTTKRR